MRTLAFMNQKGGVGKTTTAVNVGAAIARRGKKVCMIDLDPQAHLTLNFGIELPAESNTIYDVLVGETPLADACKTLGDYITVAAADIDLAGAEIELISVPGRDLVLREQIAAADGKFDYVLIDCPPSLGLLTVNALAAADSVIIPMQPHFLALQGMARLLDTIKLIHRRLNPKLSVAGVVLTMFDPQAKLSHEVVAELDRFFAGVAGKNLPWSAGRVFQTRIRRNIKLAESPSFGQPIFDYDAASNGAADYWKLADELVALFEPVPPIKKNPLDASADVRPWRVSPPTGLPAEMPPGPSGRAD